MKILILSAMDKEQKLLLESMGNAEECTVNGLTVYKGSLDSHQVYAAKCGIGKVNAALNSYRLIEALKPDLVVNSGVAGGVSGALKVGTVLIPERIAYHDVWCGPGTEAGAADGFDKYFVSAEWVVNGAQRMFGDYENVKFGLLCSGDKFIHTVEEVDEIKKNFPEADAVDMESAAIAHACAVSGTPFAVVRVMSDTPGAEENVSQYENFWSVAPEKTFETLISLLKSF